MGQHKTGRTTLQIEQHIERKARAMATIVDAGSAINFPTPALPWGRMPIQVHTVGVRVPVEMAPKKEGDEPKTEIQGFVQIMLVYKEGIEAVLMPADLAASIAEGIKATALQSKTGLDLPATPELIVPGAPQA